MLRLLPVELGVLCPTFKLGPNIRVVLGKETGGSSRVVGLLGFQGVD